MLNTGCIKKTGRQHCLLYGTTLKAVYLQKNWFQLLPVRLEGNPNIVRKRPGRSDPEDLIYLQVVQTFVHNDITDFSQTF